MDRRTFFGGIAGLLGLVQTAKPRVAEDSYFYDWTIPLTNDPAIRDSIEPGPHNRASCDGVEYKYVLRMQTGKNGWMQIFQLKNGKPFLEECNLCKNKLRRDGHVVETCSHEKVATEILFGEVKYWQV